MLNKRWNKTQIFWRQVWSGEMYVVYSLFLCGSVVCFGVVWYRVVWCGELCCGWCGVIWCGVMWCGKLLRSVVVCCGVVFWCGVV